MSKKSSNAEEPAPAQVRRPYAAPAIVWEEKLEVAGTLRMSNESGNPGCGDEGLLAPPDPLGPGRLA